MKKIGCIGLMAAVLFSTSVYASANWSYTGNTGPQNWGNLAPEFQLCSSGKMQSPIDIISAKTVNQGAVLKVAYHPVTLRLYDNGKGMVKLPQDIKTIENDHTVEIVFTTKDREMIKLNHEDYHLAQFHFHTPSEHTLNGQHFPAEIHFVSESKSGKIAVIGVWIKEGKANPALDKILNNLPKTENSLLVKKDIKTDPATLLPKNHDFYNYAGSLTTPPCTEGLNWIVMQTPITASVNQLQAMEKMLNGMNERPVQALNGRTIYNVKIEERSTAR